MCVLIRDIQARSNVCIWSNDCSQVLRSIIIIEKKSVLLCYITKTPLRFPSPILPRQKCILKQEQKPHVVPASVITYRKLPCRYNIYFCVNAKGSALLCTCFFKLVSNLCVLVLGFPQIRVFRNIMVQFSTKKKSYHEGFTSLEARMFHVVVHAETTMSRTCKAV